MPAAPILIISGPPGSGKSTVAQRLAETSELPLAVHLHTDDFYKYIHKGYIPPWLPGAQAQNTNGIEAFTAAAGRYSSGGYEVVVDGVVGPWFITPWKDLASAGYDVRYFILRPDLKTTIKRGQGRQGPEDLVDPLVLEKMWAHLAILKEYEPYAIDTGELTVAQSIELIRRKLHNGENKLS